MYQYIAGQRKIHREDAPVYKPHDPKLGKKGVPYSPENTVVNSDRPAT